MKIDKKDLPGLYQIADNASIKEQNNYFISIVIYLLLLIIASILAYFANDYPEETTLKVITALLFIITLSIIIWQKVKRSDDIWYNGRAVAESVKTRSWRWMMRTEPYMDCENEETMRKSFVNDLNTFVGEPFSPMCSGFRSFFKSSKPIILISLL